MVSTLRKVTNFQLFEEWVKSEEDLEKKKRNKFVAVKREYTNSVQF